ncbi:MAG TPA: hypothetical protein VFU43_25085 [Streptosporangiaceae bacterium]|nr:hypothetical protein [Streptosporangiaceae bacterium]
MLRRSMALSFVLAVSLILAVLSPVRAGARAAAIGEECEEEEVKAAKAASTRLLEDEEPELCGPLAPGEWKVLQDTSGGIGLPARALVDAGAQADRIPAIGRWTSEGPTNIGGRVTGVAVDPAHADTVFLTAASGGVWKSTDAATTFRSVWPDRFPQATGAIAATPDGTIYVGTGEANPGGGSLTYEGNGVYRSTDGGRTWHNLGLTNSATIGRIAVDPSDPRRIFVAATGSLFRPGGDKGVYLTTNGGRTWRRVLAGANEWTGAVDLAIAPDRPATVYASMWERQRTPSLRRYGGPGSGIYRSTDGGAHWQRLENVTALTPGDTTGLRPDDSFSRSGVAAGPGGRVYVRTATWGDFGDEKGFYVSDDGGESFATGGRHRAALGWWGGEVWVDPADRDHVFVPGQFLRESVDGGKTWTNNAGTHVDHHAIAWDPNVPGRVYEGNDGGIYRSDAGGATNTWVKATNEPWTQFYSVAASAQDPSRMTGGTQDNGSNRTWGGERWNSFNGGDGEANLIDPADQNRLYSCSQFGNCARSLDGGETLEDLSVPATEDDRFGWFSPVEFSTGDTGVVYLGGSRLFRSADGLTFTPISPDLTGGPGDDPIYPFGTLTSVWARGDQIIAGTDDGRVQVSRDLGASWSPVLTGRPWVTRVKGDPAHPDRAYVTLSGYRAGTGDGHVLTTADGGRTWRDITGNLPRAPVNDVIVGPFGVLFVATDAGVFAGIGGRWLRLGTLPLASVTDIELTAGRLFAATFGRGIYSMPLTASLTGRLARQG